MIQFLEFAKKVLEKSEVPMTYQDIWKEGVETGLDKILSTAGKTPWKTLGARLFVEVRDNPDSIFTKVGKRPAKFFLKSKMNLLSNEIIEKIDREENIPVKKRKNTLFRKRTSSSPELFCIHKRKIQQRKSDSDKDNFSRKVKKGWS